MPEETKDIAAETTDGAGAVGVDGNADVDKDTTDSDNVNDADFSDGGADAPKDPESDGDKPDEEKPVKKDVNSENARRRREAERKAAQTRNTCFFHPVTPSSPPPSTVTQMPRGAQTMLSPRREIRPVRTQTPSGQSE